MTGFANPGYPGGPAFYGNPIYYPAYNVGNPGYYGAFGNPAAFYAPYPYGYPAYSSYGYNYWNPAFYAGYPATYPYGYQGFYRGYGYPRRYPSGVQPSELSDQEIEDEVTSRLNQNAQLKAANIDVNVDAGIVTLHGEVKTEEEKDLAETLAFSVVAVRGVHNQLQVEQEPAEVEKPKRRASTARQRTKTPKKE
jgi:hypothetical protein